MTYPKSTPLPDEEPPKPTYDSRDGEDGGDSVPDHGLVGEYAENVRHQNEHNGAAYRLKHLRSAPAQEIGFTSGQGRLRPSAVHRPEERYGPVPQTFSRTPNGERIQYDSNTVPGPTSDAEAMRRRVDPGQHPRFFPRPDIALTGDGHENVVPTQSNGLSYRSAVHRTDQRY